MLIFSSDLEVWAHDSLDWRMLWAAWSHLWWLVDWKCGPRFDLSMVSRMWTRMTEFVADFVHFVGVADGRHSSRPLSVFAAYHLHSELSYSASVVQRGYAFHSLNYLDFFLIG